MPYKAKRRSKVSRRVLLPSIIVLLVALGVGGYLIHNHNKPKVTHITGGTTITQLPPKPAANNGEKQSTSSGSVNQGTATDNHGTTSSTDTSSPSQWTVSQSGVITVKQPTQNERISSGALLEGTASVSQVQYRLVDNQVGVISQGFVSVVNGTFSANINFHSYGSSGRLDVFSTDSTGREINEAQVPVNF